MYASCTSKTRALQIIAGFGTASFTSQQREIRSSQSRTFICHEMLCLVYPYVSKKALWNKVACRVYMNIKCCSHHKHEYLNTLVHTDARA